MSKFVQFMHRSMLFVVTFPPIPPCFPVYICNRIKISLSFDFALSSAEFTAGALGRHGNPRAGVSQNKYPPAKPGVLHRRVKPWITSARVTSRWYGLPAAKDCYLPPVNGPFRSFPLLAVRLPGLLLTGAGCILLSFYRFSLLYPHSILCTRTPYCDT